MGIFRKKNSEKETNVLVTPEEYKRVERTKTKIFFLIWNILSISVYTCYSLFVTYKLTEKTFLSKVIIYLLIAYAVIFLILVLVSIGSQNKMKSRLKNYKSAVKFLKYVIQIINFVLSIITAISAFITTGTTDVSAIMYAVLSLVITVFMVLFEVAKLIIRKNIPIIKQNFLEIRDREEPKKLESGDDSDAKL